MERSFSIPKKAELHRRNSIWTAGQWQIFFLVLFAHIAISLFLGWEAWDDVYIILSSSQTFAETGHIALTPISESVEASTSPLWFLAMAGVYKLDIHSVYWFHFTAQLIASLCAAASAMLLYRLIRPSIPKSAGWISVVALLLAPFRTESANGMEMTLLCVLVLGIMLILQNRETGSRSETWGLLCLSALIPWVRLEAIGYVGVAAFAIWLLSGRKRAAIVLLLGSSISAVVLSAGRLMVFDSLVPNTMLAKKMAPYTNPGGLPILDPEKIFQTLTEPVLIALPAVLLLFALSRKPDGNTRETIRTAVALGKNRELPTSVVFGISYYAAYAGVELITGNNTYNPLGRMGMSALLTLVAGVAPLCHQQEGAAKKAGRSRLKRAAPYLAATILLVVPFLGLFGEDTLLIYMNRSPHTPKLLQAIRAKSSYDNGLAMDHLRQLLGQEQFSVMLSDVGLTSFCCSRLKVLDLGLLANRELVRTGWNKFPEYLKRERPDAIETHAQFSRLSEMYSNEYFTKNYSPVVVYESMFYLRNDLFEKLKDRCVSAPIHEFYFFPFSPDPAPRKDQTPIDFSQINDLQLDATYIDSLGIKAYCRIP